MTGHYRNSVTGDAYCAAQLVGLTPGAQECASCRQHRQEVQAVRQIYILPSLRDDAARWPQHTTEVFTDTASALRVGDAYTVPGCTDRHHVVAVSDRLHDTHTDLLVYLSGEDRLVDARVRRGRLVRIERPANPPHTRTPLS
ncbi:hypothetical protein [Streptomyces luteireticuli]|uniref:hypothetical protein n=1 Tax=Streptomyces luteireticuli TaxID=173858 RepID=UPI00355867B3